MMNKKEQETFVNGKLENICSLVTSKDPLERVRGLKELNRTVMFMRPKKKWACKRVVLQALVNDYNKTH